jgi:hypothetical protein
MTSEMLPSEEGESIDYSIKVEIQSKVENAKMIYTHFYFVTKIRY